MAGEVDIIGGIASGASTGSAFGLPGAIVGGVVGGISGLLGGNAKKKARKYAKKANNLRESVYRLRSFAEQRNLLRQGQVQAAQVTALAPASGADVESSGFQGMNASVYKQMLDNYMIGDTILTNQLQANVYESKSGKAMNQADIIQSLTGFASGLVSAIPRSPAPPPNKPGWYQGALPAQSLPSDAVTYPVGGPGERPAPALIRGGN